MLQYGVNPYDQADKQSVEQLKSFRGMALTSTMFQYLDIVRAGKAFNVLQNGVPVEFVGGAGGTPVIGIYNPAASGVDIVVLETNIGVFAPGAGLGTADFNWYGGVSVEPTGEDTTPINMYTLAAAAGVNALVWTNAAMTGSTAIAEITNIASFVTTNTANGATVSNFKSNAGGMIVCKPGNLIAIGVHLTGTAATYNVNCVFTEIPTLG